MTAKLSWRKETEVAVVADANEGASEHGDRVTGWKHDPQAHADGEKLVDWGKGQNNCPAKCSELAVRPRILKSPTERRLS